MSNLETLIIDDNQKKGVKRSPYRGAVVIDDITKVAKIPKLKSFFFSFDDFHSIKIPMMRFNYETVYRKEENDAMAKSSGRLGDDYLTFRESWIKETSLL